MDKKLEYYQLTAIGDRKKNQDCTAVEVCDQFGLFLVADGLGGYQAGEKASQFFCQGIFNQAAHFLKPLQQSRWKAKEILSDWIMAAIDDMGVLFKDTPEINAKNAHTTCVLLYLDENMTVTAHCGDSRIYRLNENQVEWRTKDHSLIQKLYDEQSISEQEMGVHPDQNKLTRTINILKKYQAEVEVYPAMKKGETFLLCTDGFWEYIREDDLLQLASPGFSINELKKMVKMMNLRANGNGDNLSVQWIRHL